MTASRIRPAKPADCQQVAVLLKSAGLPIDDIDPTLPGFFVADDGGEIVGAVGMEFFGRDGLLRSLAVAPSQRNHQLGGRLCTAAVDFARAGGVKRLFLLTTDADGYFAKLAFVPIDRTLAPAPILKHEQFTRLCPDSAILMEKQL